MAAILVATLLPVAAVPAGPSAPHVASLSYANWLRAQLDSPASPAIEAAMAAAVEAAPATIDTFLDTFAAAYTAEAAGVPLARFFDAPDDLEAEALLQFLRSRFHRLSAEALVLPAMLVAASVAASGAPERAKVTGSVPLRLFEAAAARALLGTAVPTVVRSVWTRSAARPNGP